MNDKTITVFTPTYNRAYCLHKAYNSLIKQTSKDFIWLIIDDGSCDKTKDLVEDWQKSDNGFELIYVYKPNGGVHTAFNLAYRIVTTELCMCLGSDDYLLEDAIKIITDQWKKNRLSSCAGMIALNQYSNQQIVGSRLPVHKYIHLADYYSNGGSGDKKIIYRTEVFQKYPEYPEFNGETLFSVGYKYQLIDQDYMLMTVNQPICVVEYSADGYTKNMNKLRRKNPKGFAFAKRTEIKYEKNQIQLIKLIIQYNAYCILSKNMNYLKECSHKKLVFLLHPFGYFYILYILFLEKHPR